VERTRIVIADDESLIRMDLREMLTNLGYLVVGDVGDGRSAVNLAKELRPDIVIMDIKMPDMDGIEAARILTEERIAPVLLLSAYSQQELVTKAREAGVAGYLVKPFRETLETRKIVERAKGILMESQSINEAEAFRRIQKMSMNNRKPMRTVAEAIILAHQVGEH
jgi:AmiR/NasT family two-component response regulator